MVNRKYVENYIFITQHIINFQYGSEGKFLYQNVGSIKYYVRKDSLSWDLEIEV